MFEGISDEALKKELANRRIERRLKDEQERPKPTASPDIAGLQKICCQYIDELANNGYADEDYDHYILEVAIETIFGNSAWGFINKRLG